MSLILQGIEKSFTQAQTRLTIINNLDLKVGKGEVIAIVGESGSGKSTLLSLLAGFESVDGGEIIWDQQLTSNWSEKQWAEFRKLNLGFVFQNYHLIPYLTAVENVALPLRLLRKPDPEAQAQEWLQRLGLEDRAGHLPSQLSGGECQRVAIARALIHHPTLILADEPTGSLDTQTGEQVLDLLFRLLKERRQTALIVTHSPEVARRCDRVFKLSQGRLWSQ